MSKRKLKLAGYMLKILALLALGRRWIKGNYSRDKKGVPCFCLMGAVNATVPSGYRADVIQAIALQVPENYAFSLHGRIVEFNDSPLTKYTDVSRVIRKAIKALEA